MAQITLPNGKRRSKSSKTQREALNWLTTQRHSASQGTYATNDKVKLGDFLDRYLQDVAFHALRPRTFETHAGYVRNHIKPELGYIRLTDLRPEHVQRFYTVKLQAGYSKRTVQYMHAILHKALNQALKWGLVGRNVTDLVDVPKPQSKPPNIWNPDQVRVFLEAVKGHRYFPIYVTAIYTGMRQGEILGIHVGDVDLQTGIIHVRHQIQLIKGNGLTVTDLKTDKARRPVTLPLTALQVLEKHIQTVDDGLIFTTSTGKPISARNVLRHFKAVIKKLDLPDIRFHDLRHTHASLLLMAGTNPKVVQERLGHSQISLTLDTYSHVVPSLQEEAADKMERILSE